MSEKEKLQGNQNSVWLIFLQSENWLHIAKFFSTTEEKTQLLEKIINVECKEIETNDDLRVEQVLCDLL